MSNERTVLIVDESEETREVLATALERRGVKTLSTALARRGAEMAKDHHPDLVILDLELERLDPVKALEPFIGGAAQDNQPQILVLGTVSIQGENDAEFVAKPFHYGPLLRRIEEMLGDVGE